MKKPVIFRLHQDRIGMTWDLLLYVPTVSALIAYAANSWYDDNVYLAYLLVFLGTFFFLTGINRVLKTRLMLLPSAPVAIELNVDGGVTLILRNQTKIYLLKEIKLYQDFSGKSFGLSGLDGHGQRPQFVFHKGQFISPTDFQDLQASLKTLE